MVHRVAPEAKSAQADRLVAHRHAEHQKRKRQEAPVDNPDQLLVDDGHEVLRRKKAAATRQSEI
jgi:hypothetical protein